MLNYGWLIPAIPALSFVLILFFGRHLPRKGSELGIAAVVSLFLFGVITALFVDAYHGTKIKLSNDLVLLGNSGHIASSIFRDYLVPFEVVSMLLLAALVGAVVIARRD